MVLNRSRLPVLVLLKWALSAFAFLAIVLLTWVMTSQNVGVSFFLPSSEISNENNGNVDNSVTSEAWPDTPRFTIMIRMYHGSAEEYWQIFARGYLLFWPSAKKWRNADLMLVFDEESQQDHQVATVISLLPPYPKIKFEKYPPPGTLCSNWRREGYSRQVYSNFYADNHTDADFIGIADTDSFFSTKVVLEDLFENGKPRIIGYNGCCTGWEVMPSTIVDGKAIGEFMVVLGFPFIIRREHLRLFREHVVSVYQNATFEESFQYICSLHSGSYTQYDFLAFYLFAYHRDDYVWHIRDNTQAKHPAMTSGRISNDPEVSARSTPKIGVMKHAGHDGHSAFPFIIYDYVCTQANFSEKVGSCSREKGETREAIRESVEHNLATDWLVETAYWSDRHFFYSPMIRSSPEKMPENSTVLFEERAQYLKRYNGSWHW